MKTKFNKFPDDKIYCIVHEYLTTEITQPELMKKYNFGGPNTIYRWMKKLGISKQDFLQSGADRVISPDGSKSVRELELERRVGVLEDALAHEKLKSRALTTLIDVAERDLDIDIRKKRGAKQ